MRVAKPLPGTTVSRSSIVPSMSAMRSVVSKPVDHTTHGPTTATPSASPPDGAPNCTTSHGGSSHVPGHPARQHGGSPVVGSPLLSLAVELVLSSVTTAVATALEESPGSI